MGSSGQVSVDINVNAHATSTGFTDLKKDLSEINIQAKLLNNRTLGNLNNKFNTLGTTATATQRSIGAMNQEMQLVGGSAQQGATRTVAANRQIGTSYRTLAADATLSSRMMNAGLNDTAIATRNVGMQVKSIGRAFTGAGIASAVAVAPIAIGLYAAAKQGIGLEDAVYKVGSAISATDKQYRQMEQTALNFSKVGRYSSMEVAGAMYELSSAGASYSEVMQALPGVVNLATATQADLSTSAKLLTSSLKQNGEGFDQASKYANVFTASANWSLGTVDKLSESLAYFGPVANTFGIGIEKQTAVLSGLYDRGIDASTAATGLRMGLIQLSKETPMHTEVLKKYGMTYADINPAMNDFYTILGNIGKITDYTDIGKLVGAPSSTAWEVLSDPTVLAGVKEFEKRITGTNEAERTATEQMKSMQGSLFNLRGEFEQVSHDIYQQMKPAMMDLVSFMKDEMPDIGKNLGTVFEGMTPGIKDGVGQIKGMVEWFSKLDPGTLKMFGSAVTQLAVAAPALIGMGMVTRPIGDLIYGMSMVTGRMADTRAVSAYRDALCGVTTCATRGGAALPLVAGGMDAAGAAGARNAGKVAGMADELLPLAGVTAATGATRGGSLSRLGSRMDNSFLGPGGSFALPLIGAGLAYMGWREMYDTNMYGQKDAWDSASYGATSALSQLGGLVNYGIGSRSATNKLGSYQLPGLVRGDETTRIANATAFSNLDFGQQLNQLPGAFVGQGIPWITSAVAKYGGALPLIGSPLSASANVLNQGLGFVKSIGDEHSKQVAIQADADRLAAAQATANTEKAILKMSEDRLVNEQGYTKEQAKLISGVQALNEKSEGDIKNIATNRAYDEMVRQGMMTSLGIGADGLPKYGLAPGQTEREVEKQLSALTAQFEQSVTTERDGRKITVGSQEELNKAMQDNVLATYELADSVKAQGVNFDYKSSASEADILRAKSQGITSDADLNRYFKATADAQHKEEIYQELIADGVDKAEALKLIGGALARVAPNAADYKTGGSTTQTNADGSTYISHGRGDTALSQWMNPDGTYKAYSGDPANSPQNLMRDFFNSKKSAVGASPSAPGVASLAGMTQQEVKNMAAFMGVAEDKMEEFVSSGAMTEALVKPLAGAWGWGERTGVSQFGGGQRGARAPGQGTVDQLMSAAKDQAREKWLTDTYGKAQNYDYVPQFTPTTAAEATQVSAAMQVVNSLAELNRSEYAPGKSVYDSSKNQKYMDNLAAALEENTQFRTAATAAGKDIKEAAKDYAWWASGGIDNAYMNARLPAYLGQAYQGGPGGLNMNAETFNLAQLMQTAARNAGMQTGSISGATQLQTKSLEAQRNGVEVMGEVRDGIQELTRYTYDNATGELISQALRRDAEGNEEVVTEQRNAVSTLEDIQSLTPDQQNAAGEMFQTAAGGTVKPTKIGTEFLSSKFGERVQEVALMDPNGDITIQTQLVKSQTGETSIQGTPLGFGSVGEAIASPDVSKGLKEQIQQWAGSTTGKETVATAKATAAKEAEVQKTNDLNASMDIFAESLTSTSAIYRGKSGEFERTVSAFDVTTGKGTFSDLYEGTGQKTSTTFDLSTPQGYQDAIIFMSGGGNTSGVRTLNTIRTGGYTEESYESVRGIAGQFETPPGGKYTIPNEPSNYQRMLGVGRTDPSYYKSIYDSTYGTGLSYEVKDNAQSFERLQPAIDNVTRGLTTAFDSLQSVSSTRGSSVNDSDFADRTRSIFQDPIRDAENASRDLGDGMSQTLAGVGPAVNSAIMSGIPDSIDIPVNVTVNVSQTGGGGGGSVSGGYGGSNIRSTPRGSLHGGGYAH